MKVSWIFNTKLPLGGNNMEYEKPYINVIDIKQPDVICASATIGLDGTDNDSDWT